MVAFLKKIDDALDGFCHIALTLFVAAMLLLTLMNIVLRWTGNSYLWVEPLVRQLVFACAFLGGAVATGRSSHIGIDVLSKVMEARSFHLGLRWQKAVVSAASFVVVVMLAVASYDFMKQEFEYGRAEFLGIHSGVFVAVMPLGFALIGFRFLYQMVASICSK